MKKIIREELAELNVTMFLLFLLSLIFWLVVCSIYKGAMAETYLFIIIVVGMLAVTGGVGSIMLLFIKRNRIELYDDRIIQYKDINRYEYSWADVKEISFTKFKWQTWNLFVIDILVSRIMRPFRVNIHLFIENGETDTEIEFGVSNRFARAVKEHFDKIKDKA